MMGLIYNGVPTEFALKLRNWFNLQVFVETGTYQGRSAVWASQHFRQVYTIEASLDLWRQASTTYSECQNITFVHGNSGEKLREVTRRITEPALFWLDAHWSGGVTHGESDQCPLIQELVSLHGGGGDDFILIDDARLFMVPPPSPHRIEQWPSLDQIFVALAEITPETYITIFNDVIVSVPSYARKQVAVDMQQQGSAPFATPSVDVLHKLLRLITRAGRA